MEYIICAAAGYLFGCINMAYIIGRLRGFDIRERGSNNAGASNTLLTMGKPFAVIVALNDILKAFFAALLCRTLFPQIECAGIIAACGAIFGHIYPFWMRFKGGKGLASLMGMILAADWKLFLIFTAVLVIVTVITDYIALGAITVSVLYPIYLFFIAGSAVMAAVALFSTAAMLSCHIVNIRRIMSGQEVGLRAALSGK